MLNLLVVQIVAHQAVVAVIAAIAVTIVGEWLVYSEVIEHFVILLGQSVVL